MTFPDLKKYTFSGHDSFQCRLLWLKKGYDYLLNEHSFAADDAPVRLGVGNNMVRSIRYWLRAFGLTDEDEKLTKLAHLLFDSQTGFDPFLEDQATLWLLHRQLLITRHASTYWLIFNELRRRRPEFAVDDFVQYVTKVKAEQEKFTANADTLANDFKVFTKLYIQGGRQAKDREEGFAGILTELDLLKPLERKADDGKSLGTVYSIPLTDRADLPAELILYCLLDTPGLSLSINLETLETEPDMPCAVFAMNRAGLLQKIDQLTDRYPNLLIYSDQSGVRELQFKEKPTDKFQILRDYYVPALV
ncbi:DUF4007 family protein [Spirosoma spitsbergense]|uniref:DUF4007 family protein n=1 Tax=Spirosoma spitsbergense TaxID=431554 RepID=UPI00036FE700|nr:DUF4007 family protein [Spirosoma spitsbergense]